MKTNRKLRVTFLLLGVILLFGCATQNTTLKTFVDPSLQSSSIKSIAVFSLRNTALSPGEAIELDRAITQAFLQKNKNVNIMGASEATRKLNEANLVSVYSGFLSDFEHSGIPNTVVLKNIGTALGVDAILQGTLFDVKQADGVYGISASQTSLSLRYTLLDTRTGNTLWEGTSSARKNGATTLSKAPPLYKVLSIAQQKIFTGLPVLGK